MRAWRQTRRDLQISKGLSWEGRTRWKAELGLRADVSYREQILTGCKEHFLIFRALQQAKIGNWWSTHQIKMQTCFVASQKAQKCFLKIVCKCPVGHVSQCHSLQHSLLVPCHSCVTCLTRHVWG